MPAHACTYDAAAVEALRLRPLEVQTKGIHHSWVGRTATDVAGGRVTELPTPYVTIDADALEHNVALMAEWCAARGVRLAPHGKTTMAPQLFARQIDAGAWAITAASMAQVMVMRSVGISRILLANELVDPSSIAALSTMLADDPGLEFLCFVDSVAGVRLLSAGLQGPPRVQVLIEVGAHGGRAGCRSIDESLAVAAAVRESGTLTLAGVAGWDGAYGTDVSAESLNNVATFLRTTYATAVRLHGAGCFDGLDEVILSAGGSAYFDQVVEAFGQPAGFDVAVVLRSGAYVTHDDEHYLDLSPFSRGGVDGRSFRPALHAWGRVLSRPEPGLALLDLGKRDVAYDLDLPRPQAIQRPDGSSVPADGCRTTAINDQHLFLSVPADVELAVGDVVRLGVSHPCTMFDKWQLLPIVDADGRIVDLVRTCF